jgi:hypothetical protein
MSTTQSLASSLKMWSCNNDESVCTTACIVGIEIDDLVSNQTSLTPYIFTSNYQNVASVSRLRSQLNAVYIMDPVNGQVMSVMDNTQRQFTIVMKVDRVIITEEYKVCVTT